MQFLSSLFLLGFFVAAAIAQEKVLQCYVCDECDELTDAMLSNCGPDLVTPTTTATSTTLNPASTTTPTSNTGDTTIATGETTLAITGETTTTASEQPTTDASTETTPAATEDTTTQDPLSSTTTTVSTTAVIVTALVSTTVAPTTPEATPVTTSEAGISESMNSRAAAPIEAVPNLLPKQLSAAALLIRNYRSISRTSRAAEISYACYKINLSDNSDSPKWKRGCVAIPTAKEGCEVVREENNVPADAKDCRACTTDGCNSSAALRLSVFAVLAALVVKFLM